MRKKYNLVISWFMIIFSIFLWGIDFDYTGLFVMLIGWLFRIDLPDKKYINNYYKRNSSFINKIKILSMIMGMLIFLYVIYSIIIDEYEYLNDHWLMIKLILLIVSPVLILIVKFEIELYKYYTNQE